MSEEKVPIIFIGEYHENDVSRFCGMAKMLHDPIEEEIYERLLSEYQRDTSKKTLFINEGSCYNLRNDSIMRKLSELGIHKDNFRILQEFDINDKSLRGSKAMYYISGLIELLVLFDSSIYKKESMPKFDYQYGMEIDEKYYLNTIFGTSLHDIITKKQKFSLGLMIKTILKEELVQSDYEFYERVYNTLITDFITLYRPFVDTLFIDIYLDVFESLLSKTSEERESLYPIIKERLRSIRDVSIIRNIEKQVVEEEINMVVLYFGASHYTNMLDLISKSTIVVADSLVYNMIELEEMIRTGEFAEHPLLYRLVTKFHSNIFAMKEFIVGKV